jgi:putative transposase
MSNSYRIEIPGGLYHVNTNAVDGVKAFPDFRHRQKFMDLVGEEIEKSRWRCLGYTVVGTHYHLLIRIQELTLSSGFQRLNSRYARWFNLNHARRGAFWQSRFHDTLVETDSHLLELQRYLAYNAPRANLADAPEDWPYCNYGSLIGAQGPDPYVDEAALLALMARNPRRARQLFREFVEERDPRVRRRQTLLRRRSDAED